MTDVHGLGGIMKAGGGTYGRRHPRSVALIRLASGLGLIAVTAVLCSRGWYWGTALLPFAALHFWLAARLLINVGRTASTRRDRTDATGRLKGAPR